MESWVGLGEFVSFSSQINLAPSTPVGRLRTVTNKHLVFPHISWLLWQQVPNTLHTWHDKNMICSLSGGGTPISVPSPDTWTLLTWKFWDVCNITPLSKDTDLPPTTAAINSWNVLWRWIEHLVLMGTCSKQLIHELENNLNAWSHVSAFHSWS